MLLSAHGEHTLLTLSSSKPVADQISALSADGTHLAFAVGGSAFVYDVSTGRLTGIKNAEKVDGAIEQQSTDLYRELTTINATTVSSTL